MINIKAVLGIATLAFVLAANTIVAQAQDTTTPVTTTAEIDRDDDSGKWGLAGLLGLLGLVGLKRRDHDRVHTTTTRR